ncbi:hypothetical protein GCM10027188_09730 [Lysobacter humi (ex Lee et al. 2017)]
MLGWWVLNGLISTVQMLAILEARGRPASVDGVLVSEMGSALLWVPATLWLLWCTARRPFERERWLGSLAILVAAAFVAGAFRASGVLLLHPWVGPYNAPPQWDEIFIGNVVKDMLRGGLIIGVGHALVYAQRARMQERQARELQERLTQARLDALSAQLNPHFLFNALNSIAEMVHHDVDAADRMLVQLGGILRYSLESSREQLTSLQDELEAIDGYIGIEQVRLGGRLRFRRDVERDALHARVPRLMLLPLVENAVTHAAALRASPSEVTVRAALRDGRLLVEVLDDGPGAPGRAGFGVGLANTRGRLECLYGADQSLAITTLPNGGTRVAVSLPLHHAAANA